MAKHLTWPRLLGAVGAVALCTGLWMQLSEMPDEPDRPRLMIMTALPLGWQGLTIDAVVSGAATKSPLSTWLGHFYDTQMLDRLAPETLTSGSPLLIAQPRRLAPEELFALDNWVRAGGRVLVLDDPELHWALGHLGDPTSAPPASLLDPLLTHWGIQLELSLPGTAKNDMPSPPGSGGGKGVGTWTVLKPECGATENRAIAFCKLGKGRADLIADADWIAPSLWFAGGNPLRPSQHMSDNAAVLIDQIDAAAGAQPRHVAARLMKRQDSGLNLVYVGIAMLLLAFAASLGRWGRRIKG